MNETISIYNAKNGEIRIEQIEVEDFIEESPIIQEPTLEEQIVKLKQTNEIQDVLIDTTMLATDEMFTMIEPLLSQVAETLQLAKEVSKLVDMYVAMIMRGLKTIDEVPSRYREQVKEILGQLEK